MHEDVRDALDGAREFSYAIADLLERIARIRARRPAAGGLVLPEVDSKGRLHELYLTPGTTRSLPAQRLVEEIMAAIGESTADAQRQRTILLATMRLPRPRARERTKVVVRSRQRPAALSRTE